MLNWRSQTMMRLNLREVLVFIESLFIKNKERQRHEEAIKAIYATQYGAFRHF